MIFLFAYTLITGPVGNREVFRELDTDGSGSLEKFTFEAALHKLGVFLPLYEVNALARKFAAPQGVNRVDYDAFLRALQLPLNDRRRAIVTKAWLKINPEGALLQSFEMSC
jgi:Ca2+-binding EF-hand superfamily protein